MELDFNVGADGAAQTVLVPLAAAQKRLHPAGLRQIKRATGGPRLTAPT